jgi:Uncharacterized alpha/beta hydrolase domain (DUF2235)
LGQRSGAIAFAASGTSINAAPTQGAASAAPSRMKLVAQNALAGAKQVEQVAPPTTCQQCLTLSFFFDGTGNNLDADVGTMQHSNVSRLFQSRLEDDKTLNRFSFYIPGLGTRFKEIGDPGHTTRGLGMGAMGQDRLDWAFKQFDEKLRDAEKRAENPTNKILRISVSVFGFSRGATAARAFVRDLEKRCELKSGTYQLKQGQYPIEVLFLGIFDTVASVGLPMSANNTPGATSAGLYGTQTTLNVRASYSESSIPGIAFGEPGADPAPGSFDGHASWADGLAVPAPDFVKRCVHMVAAHEIRNSFPSDSALNGTRYPTGVSEMVYPGAHSDVGGGYQPGEGARSTDPAEMLSLVPLRAMHSEAVAAGVALYSLSAIPRLGPLVEKSFALDADSAKKYAETVKSFSHYLQSAGSGGREIGKELLAHTSWFLRWRFFSIRRNEKAGGVGPDAKAISEREPGFAAARKALKESVDALEAKSKSAYQEYARAQSKLTQQEINQARFGFPINADVQARATQANEKYQAAQDQYLAEKAKLDTYANDSALISNMAAYDRRLVEDARAIAKHHKANTKLKLRPHYGNLIDAYNDQYLKNLPLDQGVVDFFDKYVHDSLAGFATDATLPSDPRVIYAGGDNKIRFAGLMTPPQPGQPMAA